jgi:hypothetical protein
VGTLRKLHGHRSVTHLPLGDRQAATCFSGGCWKIDNLSPCFLVRLTTVLGGISTLKSTGSARRSDPRLLEQSDDADRPGREYRHRGLHGLLQLTSTLKRSPVNGQPGPVTAMKQVCTGLLSDREPGAALPVCRAG